MSDAKQTPIQELLRRVPLKHRVAMVDGPHSATYIPTGRLAHEAADEIDRLRAENERLRQDAERLDYIEGLDHIERYYEHGPDMSGNHVWFPTPHHLRFRGLTFRAAVDAARVSGGEK